MKQFLLSIFLLFFSLSYGQFAIVSDKDSLLNVRSEGHVNSKVIDQLPNGHVIYCFETNGNWSNINYNKKGKELTGYVYKDRHKLISSFSSLKILQETKNSITLKKDTFEILITQSKFLTKEHKFTYVKGYPDQIELIDNEKYWGMDGGIPTTQFDNIVIKAGQKITTLPKKTLEGLYQPNLSTAKVNYDQDTDTFYIETMNSDGAGGYLVIWKIVKGIYEDRLVVHGF